MADTIKKIVEVEIDVDSSEVKQLDKELVKTKKTLKKTSKESESFGDKVIKVGDAIKGLGIGLAISGLQKLGQAFQKNQRIADATEQAFTGLELAFSNLTDKVLSGVDKQSTSWSRLASNALKLTGPLGNVLSVFLDTNKASQDYIDNLEKVSEQMVQNRKDLMLLEVEQRRFQLLNQNEAEIQRQIRDDYTLTFEQRFEANDKLAKILDESIKKEQEVTKTRIANLQYIQDNLTYSFEREVEIKNLKVELLDIEERITGVKSEQQAAERSLYAEQKALREQADKDRADALKESEEAFQEWWDNLNEIADKQADLDYDKRMARLHRELEAIQDQKDSEIEVRENYFKEIEDLDERVFNNSLSFQELEIKAVQDQYFTLLELADQYGVDKAYLQSQQQKEINEINKRYAAEDIVAEAAAAEAKRAIQQQNLDSAKAAIDIVKQYAGENKKVQAAAILADSFVGIAKTIISTQSANAAALATPQAIATSGAAAAPVIAANNIAAGISIAGITAATATGLASLGQSGGGGGGASQSLGGGSQGGGAPQFNTVGTSGFNQVAGSIADQNQQPVQAYVVSTDITTQQSLDRNSRNKASFP